MSIVTQDTTLKLMFDCPHQNRMPSELQLQRSLQATTPALEIATAKVKTLGFAQAKIGTLWLFETTAWLKTSLQRLVSTR